MSHTTEDRLADVKAAWRIASDSADRFRDVITQALDLPENPGDNELCRLLLVAHGKDPAQEATRWREFCDGAVKRLVEAGFNDPSPEGADQ